MKDTPLFTELLRLVQQIEPDKPVEILIEKILSALKEDELDQEDVVPGWLPEIIRTLADGDYTKWIDFSRPDWDDTSAMDFLSNLKDWLPCGYLNNDESRLWIFPDLNREMCIFLEGSCFKISAIGKTWE